MKRGYITLSFLIICFIPLSVSAQKSNERSVWITEFNKPITLDSLTIEPSSIHLSDTVSFTFEYHQEPGIIRIVTIKKDPPDSVKVSYTVFPYNFNRNFTRRDKAIIDTSGLIQRQAIRIGPPIKHREELFETQNLYKSGALSRGISFGNRQDIFVNSVLNLQMDGNLTEDLKISASITDQNIPYQPEGNTRLVQDFDNVFIRLYSDDISVTAGDLVLQNQDSYFLKYYKNVKGGMVDAHYKTFGKTTSHSRAVYSVAKGKFASYQIPVLDGVSGPYKIRGPENQRYVIVIANSEKAFLDGRLLVRGYANDYTIDYNTGEVTFTPNILITKFSRVRIDFEYSQQNYSRSIMALDQTLEAGPASLSISYYQEKDNPNQPILMNLSDNEKQYLGTLGEDITRAFIPAYDSTGWSSEQILYKMKDTVNHAEDIVTIFQYSTNPDSAFYQVIFTEVGWGDGDYIFKTSLAKGRVYEWRMDVNGVKQGNFMPVRQVTLPNKKSMLSFQSNIDLTDNESVFVEAAFSGLDKNLYSTTGDRNNTGIAYKIGIQTDKRGIGQLQDWVFSGGADFEFNSADFSPIDRFRYIEFDRDWSFNPDMELIQSADNILNVSGILKKDAAHHVNASLSRRLRGNSVNGWQENVGMGFSLGKLMIESDFFHMANKNRTYNSSWDRVNFTTFYKTRALVPGYEYSVDRNEIRLGDSDSLISTAMNYEEHKVFLRSSDSSRSSWQIDYGIRKDRLPVFGEMKDRNLSKTASLQYSLPQNKLGKIRAVLTYRNLEYLNVPDSTLSDETLLGRFDWFAGFLDKHIRSELTYALGNGRELKREYIYLEVPIGQGTHTWRDDNGDEVQDLNEFYLAINPDERIYIKVFVPTDEYILAYDNQINYRLGLSMPRSWRNLDGMKGLLSKFSNQLAINLQNKTINKRLISRFLPYYTNLPENDILSRRENIRNTIFFNRSNPTYGMDLNILRSGNRQLLVNGFESRFNRETSLNIRANLKKQYNLKASAVSGTNESASDYLVDRNYILRKRILNPELAWQPSDFWRFTGFYSYTDKYNISQEQRGEFSVINEFGFRIKYSKAIQRMMTFSARYINIQFQGEENSAMGYELLNALKPGGNLTWSFILNQKLMNGLQFNVIYEGRKSESNPVIHTGRMQVTALF